MLTLHPIPAFSDNYIWCLHDDQTAYVVDPGQAQPVLDYLAKHHLQLKGILITHHHWDHVSGLGEILEQFGHIPVWYPKQETIDHGNQPLDAGDVIELQLASTALQFEVLCLPGHTLGHIAYYCAQTPTGPVLFCGDTLFSAGCGRLFEGTPQQMYESLGQLKALPENTLVCCTHEYTLSNLNFARAVEPNNQDIQSHLQKVQRLREQNLPSLPTDMATENRINPFLRVDNEDIKQSLQSNCGQRPKSNVDSFAKLREWKDSF